MDAAVEDALVVGYEPLISALELPDPDDRHVLAAAIRCNAQEIVTFNLKDFPADVLAAYDVLAIHPDEFVENQFDLKQGLVLNVAKRHRAALRNPPKSAGDYIETLAAQGLPVSADRLRDFIDVL